MPEYLQNFTSLNAWDFVSYMNQIGWPQNGSFSILLPTLGYHFREVGGRMVTRKHAIFVTDALSILIFEL